MAKRPPYFPFYVADFAFDPKVEAMSTMAVGAYILLLCKAWHEDPPATLPNVDRVLARYARLSPDEWLEVKPEVLAAFRVGDDNRLHQKRLRREYEAFATKSKTRRKAAEKRWANADGEQKQCTSNAYASKRGSGSDSDFSSQGESEGKEPEGFTRFWKTYPRKIGKRTALAAWKRLKLESQADVVIAAVKAQKSSDQWQQEGGKFIPHPTTWLNRGSWEDEVGPEPETRPATDAEIDALLAEGDDDE